MLWWRIADIVKSRYQCQIDCTSTATEDVRASPLTASNLLVKELPMKRNECFDYNCTIFDPNAVLTANLSQETKGTHGESWWRQSWKEKVSREEGSEASTGMKKTLRSSLCFVEVMTGPLLGDDRSKVLEVTPYLDYVDAGKEARVKVRLLCSSPFDSCSFWTRLRFVPYAIWLYSFLNRFCFRFVRFRIDLDLLRVRVLCVFVIIFRFRYVSV